MKLKALASCIALSLFFTGCSSYTLEDYNSDSDKIDLIMEELGLISSDILFAETQEDMEKAAKDFKKFVNDKDIKTPEGKEIVEVAKETVDFAIEELEGHTSFISKVTKIEALSNSQKYLEIVEKGEQATDAFLDKVDELSK